ncbi:MAG TPA: slipin family protein [Bacillota bacterium]|jgi:regulator of protease activity HflC (stomatin/prohibitin superfamily)
MAYLAIPIVVIAIIVSMARIINQFQEGVIFRFGRVAKSLKPGLNFIVPFGIDRLVAVDMRTFTIDVPRQEIITKDNVPVMVDAVIYFNVFDPVLSVTKVANHVQSTTLLGQTTLRAVLGQHELDDMLTKRADLNNILQDQLDKATDQWGIKVSMVEVKSVELPDTMKRAMAKQAEAERERRAKVIAAEGELQASQKLTEAASVLATVPVAVELRRLQVLTEIATEKNSTIVFPVPMELVRLWDSMTKK